MSCFNLVFNIALAPVSPHITYQLRRASSRVMKIGSSTTRPIFAQLLCHDQGPSLQQRRLKKTQVELASSSQLWTLLDELEALPRESNNIQHEKTELSLGLPLSPLMDTNLISARERHRLPKPKLDKEKAPDLEKELFMNPYGQTWTMHNSAT